MHIKGKRTLVENDAMPLVFEGASEEGEIAAVTVVTPADIAMANEEWSEIAEYVHGAQLEAVRRVLICCFGDSRKPKDAILTLALIAYIACPHILKNNSLEAIAKDYDTTKQVLSYRLLKINKELGLRSRNQKSDRARESYSNHTKAWHRARKAEKAALDKIRRETKHIGKHLPEE